MTITTQKELRRAFWEAHPDASRRTLLGGDYCTDTRCAFVFWIDALERDGTISPDLAQRATL